MERPRVAHVITGLGTGGAEHSLATLLAGQAGLYEAAVISLSSDGPVGSRIAELGLPVHTLGMRPGGFRPGSALALSELLRRLRPDLVQGWMYHGNLAAWAASRLGRDRGLLLWNIRHTPGKLWNEKPLTAAVIRAGALVSKAAEAIIYNSWVSAARHERLGYSAGRRRVIPNGFDLDRFRPRPDARSRIRGELGLGDDAVIVGLVARYHPVKDHATFLGAAREVSSRFPGVHFLLAGRGVERENGELVGRISALGLGGCVSLVGERRDVPEILASLDVACLSSRAEGLPNVVGEAMASGVACVVTEVGDSRRLVAETGIVVPPRDARALAAGLGELVGLERDARQRLGEAARRRIADEFSLERMWTSYDDLYSELLNVRHRRHRPERTAS